MLPLSTFVAGLLNLAHDLREAPDYNTHPTAAALHAIVDSRSAAELHGFRGYVVLRGEELVAEQITHVLIKGVSTHRISTVSKSKKTNKLHVTCSY